MTLDATVRDTMDADDAGRSSSSSSGNNILVSSDLFSYKIVIVVVDRNADE